jgi:hypothetical protein
VLRRPRTGRFRRFLPEARALPTRQPPGSPGRTASPIPPPALAARAPSATITVAPSARSRPSRRAHDDRAAQLGAHVDVRPFITGSGVTGIVNRDRAQAWNAAVSGTKVTYTPKRDYFGAGYLHLPRVRQRRRLGPRYRDRHVIGRSDPSKDASVIGVVGAQGDDDAAPRARAESATSSRTSNPCTRAPRKPSASRAANPIAGAGAVPQRNAEPPPVQLAAASGSGLTGPLPRQHDERSFGRPREFDHEPRRPRSRSASTPRRGNSP